MRTIYCTCGHAEAEHFDNNHGTNQGTGCRVALLLHEGDVLARNIERRCGCRRFELSSLQPTGLVCGHQFPNGSFCNRPKEHRETETPE